MPNRLFFVVAAFLLPLTCFAAGWQPSGPWGGSATAITVDPQNPDVLLLGARNSLIFRSTDQGKHWTRLPFPRHFLATVAALVIHPSDSRRYLAALSLDNSYYAGIWFSTDAGATWNQAEGVTGISAEAIALWPKEPSRVYAGTRDGVWMSEDGGVVFKRISAPYNHELRGVTAIAVDPENPLTVYAGTTHLPWKTTDGGRTWISIHEGMLDDSDVFSIFIDPGRPARVFASACSGIYQSDSAGQSWTRFNGIPASHRRTHVIRIKPGAPDVIYAGTTLGLLKSSGGSPFRQINRLHILSMAFDPRNPDRFYLATEGTGVWISEDGGASLAPLNDGFVNRRIAGVAGAGNDLYLNVLQNGTAGGIYSSADGGLSWTLAAPAAALGDNHMSLLAAAPLELNVIFAGNETSLVRSMDGGRKWKPLALPGKTPKGAPRLTALLAVPSSQTPRKPVLFAGSSRGLFRSFDLGASWQPARLTSANIQHSVETIYSAPAAPSRLIVKTTQAVYVSEDAGASWRVLNILFPVGTIYDLVLAGPAGASILAATAQGLYVSEDAGRTWSHRENGLAPGTISSLTVRPAVASEVYATQFGRLYRSSNAGRDWTLIPGAEIPETSVGRLAFLPSSPSRLLALTPDLGVYYLDVSTLQ